MNEGPHPAGLGRHPGPWDSVKHWLVLAPHPDDFDVAAITLKYLQDQGARISLEVLSGGASGVEDTFANDWEAKTAARESEQRNSCALFGLPSNALRFRRLAEDADGCMADIPENQSRVHALLDCKKPDGVILPHGNDSNADHRRTFRWFQSWRIKQAKQPLALFVRDPKNLGMKVDLITPYNAQQAAWKAKLLRCHRSQHDRNLQTRSIGFDERILGPERAAGESFGFHAVECFEWMIDH